MAKFGCDSKEGTFSVMEARVLRILILHWVALVAGTAVWGL